MANDTDKEPSIEEILTSIRQIISDDDDEDAKTPAKKAPEPVAEPEPEEDEIIELTQRIDPEPARRQKPEPEDEEDDFGATLEKVMEIDMKDVGSDSDFDDDEMVAAMDDDLDAFEPEPPPPPPRPAPRFEPVEDDQPADSLLTKRAEDAAYSGFKRLAAKTAIDTISGVTIEEIVRDELRPMLRVWLDQNLPGIVERLVQEELDRVAKRALED